MAIITLGVIILMVALVIVFALKMFWVASIIIFYRFIGSILTAEVAQNQLGIDSPLIYFMVVLTLSFLLHYVIVVRLLSELYPFKVFLFIAMGVWILFHYDLLELLLLRDWLTENGLIGVENVQNSIKELFSMPLDEKTRYIYGGLQNFSDVLWGVIDALKLAVVSVVDFIKELFTAKGTE